MDLLWKGLLIFGATAVSDLIWTMWILHATAGHKWRAASFSSAVIVLSGVTVVSYVEDHRLLAPAALGAFVGTWLTLHMKGKDAKGKL